MTDKENKEYQSLIDKRHTRKGLTRKEHKRYVQFVDKAILEGLPKIAKAWMQAFSQ